MNAPLKHVNPATMTVLNPVSPRRSSTMPMAERLASLEGKLIGLLSNGKPASEEVLTGVRRMLAARFTGARFEFRRKAHASAQAPFIPSLIGRWDAAVVAIGD